MKETFRSLAIELGFDLCRFTSADPPETGAQFTDWLAKEYHGEMAWMARNAPKRLDPALILPGARSVIVLAASYHRPAAESGVPQSRSGVVARYARRTDYHDLLAPKLKELCAVLEREMGPETHSLWYVDTGPILERAIAERAGIGFAGKHTNLISRTLGNWFLLAEILTTASFEPDSSEQNRCGSCTRCLTACPTEAIRAPFQLDARRCISYLTIELKGSIPEEWRRAIGNRVFGCDDCLAVCPWNRFAKEGRLLQEGVRPELDQPDLLEWLSIDEVEFRRRFAGTPMIRTKRRGLLRNVCVALGNIGDAEALPALERASKDPEPLIAEHARWAIQQITSRGCG